MGKIKCTFRDSWGNFFFPFRGFATQGEESRPYFSSAWDWHISLFLRNRELANSLFWTKCQFFLCITYLTKKNCMLSFFQIISTQMDISVSFFALIQCYWLEDGSEVLENSLLIPQWKKLEFPTRGFAARGEFIFFHLGIRREFSNTSSPSSSHYLIVLDWKIKH